MHFDLKNEELKRIPTSAPFILVANRLLDGVDEAILMGVLESLKVPYQVLSSVSASIPESHQQFQLHQIHETGESLPVFDRIRSLFRKLKKGEVKENLLVIIDFPVGRIGEFRSTRSMQKLFQKLKELDRPIVPVRISSSDPALLTSGVGGRLYSRLTNQARKIEVRIGNPIRIEDQNQFENPSRFSRYVRSKIFALGSSLEVRKFFNFPFRDRSVPEEAIAEPINSKKIAEDIRQLAFHNLLASQGPFDVFSASAVEIPNALFEIGRLRELTFREVGEGTGKSRDLDEYDLYYNQLIIWDREAERIIGGYRMGLGRQIFDQMGVQGFYVHSLFRIEEGFYPIMQQSVELGRSYIIPEYQKKRLPLFLLWQGILAFLLQNPHYKYLYGPVSISKYYSNISKSLIVAFLKKFYFDKDLAQFLSARKPFKTKLEKVDIDLLMDHLGEEVRDLDTIIEDIEPDHFRIPVLMRQYIKMNARFISFNVDPNFSDVLDGFILLNLEDVPYPMIENLMRKEK